MGQRSERKKFQAAAAVPQQAASRLQSCSQEGLPVYRVALSLHCTLVFCCMG